MKKGRKFKGGGIIKKYLLYLYIQYCGARGIKIDHQNLRLDDKYFIDWLVDNHILCDKYKEYLKELGVLSEYEYSQIGKELYEYLEVGKGLYDTISDTSSKRCSLFAETMHTNNSDFILLDNQPLVVSDSKIIIPKHKVILTHNPHVCYDISNWYRIHNNGMYDISVGMYGTIYDEDIEDKIRQLKLLADNMTDDYTIDYDTDKDIYFCSLNSKRKILKRTRILSR